MNRVLDRMNLDFVKAESGSMVTEAVEKAVSYTHLSDCIPQKEVKNDRQQKRNRRKIK